MLRACDRTVSTRRHGDRMDAMRWDGKAEARCIADPLSPDPAHEIDIRTGELWQECRKHPIIIKTGEEWPDN